MKRIVFLGGLLTALALVAVLGTVAFMLFTVDTLVGDAARATGRSSYGVDVTIADVDMSLKSGKSQFIGVRVANPPGFSGATAIEIPAVEIIVDTRRPTADAVAIKQVKLVRPKVILEISGGIANLAAFDGTGKQSGASAPTGQRLVIDQILLVEGELILRADFLDGRELTTKIPDMRVADIGKKEQGAPPAEIARIVMEMLVLAAERASRRFDIPAATNGKAPAIDFKKLLGN